MRSPSIALRVFGLTVLVFALPLLIYFLIVFYQSYQRREGEVVDQLKNTGQNRALLLEQAEEFSLRTLGVVESLMGVGALDKLLVSVTEGGDFHSAFFVKNEKGQYFATAASSPAMLGQDLTDLPQFAQAEKEGSATFLGFDLTSRERVLWVLKRTSDGVLVLTTPIKHILQTLGEPGKGISFSLVDPAGEIFASSNPELISEQLLGDQPVLTLQEKYLAVRVPIEGTSLSLLVDVNKEQAIGKRLDRLWQVLVIFAIVLVVVFIPALWLTLRMGRPLKQLAQTMKQASLGDFSVRYNEDRFGFEINKLGQIFNETLGSLTENIEKVEAERIGREMLAKELAIGKEIQLSLIPPQPPQFPDAKIAARFLPAREVGGDFYDVYAKGDDIVFTVADAAGKGISACLYSLSLRGMLRAACNAYTDHGEIVREANNLFCQDTGKTGMFVTGFVAIYHPGNQTLTYSSSGHPPALLLRKDGTLERLTSGGLPFGIQEVSYVEGACTPVSPGDFLLIYTDGVTEARNVEGELFGEERLVEAIKSFEPDDVLHNLMERITTFVGGNPQSDDITLLAVKIGG